MRSGYGEIGPLEIIKVNARNLVPGDVITHNGHMKVVLRSYTNENVNQQALDVESGEQDEDGEHLSPYRINIPVDEQCLILRAKTSVSGSPAPKPE